jgi:hypothetical protein
MNELEDRLRHALAREKPPSGFSARVLRRVSEDVEPTPRLADRPVMRWAAAALIVAALGGALEYRSVQKAREERARGEAAKEQVMQALRIAGSKLQLVQAAVKEIGS